MRVFTDGTDAVLAGHIRRLLPLMSILVFFDGLQTVMQGVVQVG